MTRMADSPSPDEAVAVLDAAGTPLACSRRFIELLDLEGDGLSGLAALLAGAAREAEGDGRWRIAGPVPVLLNTESAGELSLVHAWTETEDARPGPIGGTAQLTAYGRLAEGMAHDARNPLNALAIHLELLEDRLAARPEGLGDAERHLTTMRAQVRRIDAILKRFLRFASPHQQPAGTVDLAELVQQAVEVCSHQAHRGGVRLESRLEEARVSGNVAQLGQAILHLVMQGIDASLGGSMRIALDRSGGEAVLSLIDEPGACSKPATTVEDGELGLSLAEQIVELHLGNLVARTEAGSTRVEVRLPLAAGG